MRRDGVMIALPVTAILGMDFPGLCVTT